MEKKKKTPRRLSCNLWAFKYVMFLILVSGCQPLLLAVRRCWGLLTVDPNTPFYIYCFCLAVCK